MDERVERGPRAAMQSHDCQLRPIPSPAFPERERSLHRRHVALQAHHEVLVAARLDSEQADSDSLDDLVAITAVMLRRASRKAQGQVAACSRTARRHRRAELLHDLLHDPVHINSLDGARIRRRGRAAAGRHAPPPRNPQSARMHAILERMSSRPSCSFGREQLPARAEREAPQRHARAKAVREVHAGKAWRRSESSSLNWMRFASSQWPARNSVVQFHDHLGHDSARGDGPAVRAHEQRGNRISSHSDQAGEVRTLGLDGVQRR